VLIGISGSAIYFQETYDPVATTLEKFIELNYSRTKRSYAKLSCFSGTRQRSDLLLWWASTTVFAAEESYQKTLAGALDSEVKCTLVLHLRYASKSSSVINTP
jgi:chlorite dismutase